jgi:predicted Rossmann-fold nucleotide-binding protein
MEEAFETISWTQLGLQDKPTGFLNVAGFFDPLKAQLDRMVGEAFVRQQHRDVVYFEERPADLLGRLRGFTPPGVNKWIDLSAEG